MKRVTRQFGELEYESDHVVELPEGLIGFEQYHQFVIVNDEGSEPFRWLVSVETEDLSFPLLDPALLLPGYASNAVAAEKEVWVIASLSRNVERSSVNLRSPIVIDRKSHMGQQVILDDDTLPFQFPLVPAQEPAGERR